MINSWEEVTLETDVLVIGGGIAGCMAAIRARELGAEVTLLEKGNTRRSGCAATGIDHCWTYIPPIHGSHCSVEDIVEDHCRNADGFIFKDLVHFIAANSYQRILDLEKFGVPMRDETGTFRLVKKIHRVPNFLHFAGRDMKVKLTREATRRGAHIINRVMATDLIIADGEVVGCVGVSTRSFRLFIIKAGAVIITTGNVFRLYRSPTGIAFNLSHPPSETGDGSAMALRAGAALINMEFVTMQTGPKNFERCGRGTYVPGVLRDGFGLPLGEKSPDPDDTIGTQRLPGAKAMGTMPAAVESPVGFMRILQSGRGPIYMDCTADTAEQIEYIKWGLRNEGNTVFLDYLANEGIRLSKDLIEFSVYEPKLSNGNSGLQINVRCETNLPGLYAAGDAIGGVKRSVCPGALSLGWQAGEQAAGRSRSKTRSAFELPKAETVQQRKASVSEISNRRSDATWQDAQIALQNIMDDYGGLIRSETMLKAGLARLLQLRDRMHSEVGAPTPHEVYRTCEVFNLLDIGEVVMTAALERKESRFSPGYHFRADYPRPDNENWRKFIVVRRVGAGLQTTTVDL